MKNLIVMLGVMWMSACAVPGDRPAPSDEPASAQAVTPDPDEGDASAASELALGGATLAACPAANVCFNGVMHTCDPNWSLPRSCGVQSCGAPCGAEGADTRAILQPTQVSRKCQDLAGHVCTEFAIGRVAVGCGQGICGGEPFPDE